MREIFKATYTVTIGDINYGGHLGHDRSLLIFQDARIRLLQEHSYTEMDIGEGKGLVVVEAGCRYLREVFVHEELEIAVSLLEMKEKTFTLRYLVQRAEDRQEVLDGFTVILAYDYQKKKATTIPNSFLVEYR